MTGKQNTVLRMYRSVILYADPHSAVWTGFMPFNNAYNDFKSAVAVLDSLIPASGIPTTAISGSKAEIRDRLEGKMFIAATGLSTFGYTANDRNAIGAAAGINRHALDKMEEEALWKTAGDLNAAASAVGSALNDYGITPQFLADMMADATLFKGKIGGAKAVRAGNKEVTEDIAAQIRSISGILNNRLDGAAELLRAAQPAFVTGYFAARDIDDAAHTRLALRLRVTDGNGAALSNVLVAVADKTRHTSAAGACQFANLPQGLQSVTCSKAGYQQTAATVPITHGETAELVVQMARA